MSRKFTLKLLFCFIVLFFTIGVKAEKTFTLDNYLYNTYGARGVYSPRSMNDGEHYSRLSPDRKKIIRYAWKTGTIVDTLLNIETCKGNSELKRIDGYSFSDNEQKIMVYTDRKSIYRRSFTARYFVYKMRRNRMEALSEGRQQMATFSPNGRMVAFVKNNNLYLKKLDFGTESAITKDGLFNQIINGLPDWVYEEEFSTNKSFCWSPDNNIVAFIRYDESQVRSYGFHFYGGRFPTHTNAVNYPQLYSFKYPKSGEDNSTVSVHSYSVKSKDIKKIQLPLEKEGYIPRIRFVSPTQLALFTLNRRQNRLQMYYANPYSTVSKCVYEEKNAYYLEAEMLDQMIFTKDHFVLLSEKDGYSHAYLYSLLGSPIKQLTKGNYDVTALLGYNEKTKTLYYQAAKSSPLHREIYRADKKGRVTLLTSLIGTNNAVFSSNCAYYQNTFQNVKTPPITTVYSTRRNKALYVVEDNKKTKAKVAEANMPQKEFFTLMNETGDTLNGWMVKPVNFDPSKQYPVLMTQYSGPNSQSVKDSYGCGWEQYLAANGYVVACVDGRGTGFRGEAFRKSHTYLRLGGAEVEDQIAAAKYLGSLDYIDAKRIGIWGWSYGGYMTLMCMSKGKGVFKVGIAVAAPSRWEYYDTIYAERYMRTPKENGDGYKSSAPFTWLKGFKGKLLICHGLADDNVHYQNFAEYTEALVQAGIQFEMQTYTNRNHSIYGGNTRRHLYTRMSQFLFKNL